MNTDKARMIRKQNEELRAAAIALLTFIRERYPADFVEGGPGYSCPHHVALAAALGPEAPQ